MGLSTLKVGYTSQTKTPLKKTEYKNHIITKALLLVSSALFAQQESDFTFYKSHMLLVNPAYAGYNNETLGSVLEKIMGMAS